MENNKLTLLTPQDELESKLMSEDNLDNIKEIIELFNLNIKKKDVIRSNKLSDIQDKISDQIAQRIDKRAGEFSNADLLNYLKVVNDIINKSDNSLDNVKLPSIQINQQNNVNVDLSTTHGLGKDSRDHVVDAVQSILKKLSKQNAIQNADVIETVGEEVKDE